MTGFKTRHRLESFSLSRNHHNFTKNLVFVKFFYLKLRPDRPSRCFITSSVKEAYLPPENSRNFW